MSILETVVTIDDVKILKTGVNKKGNPYTMAGVVGGGKTFVTFKNELREEAEGHKGATAKVLYTQEQNGDYTNYTLQALEVVSNGTVSPSNGSVDVNQLQVPIPSQDEFRRSKQEMRWTECLHIAAAIENAHPDSAGFDMDIFLDFAATIYESIKNFQEPTDEIPFGA